MSHFEPRPTAKESGFEWLPEIPQDWRMDPIGRIFLEVKDRGGSKNELLAVSQEHGILPQDEYSALIDRRLSQSESGDYSNYKRVRPGDFVYNKMRMWQGAIGFSKYDGCVSPAYVVFRPRCEIAHWFYQWLFKTNDFLVEVNRRSQGICDDQNSCGFESFREIAIPRPPFHDQVAVSKTIGAEASRIDTLIEKKTRFIELLKEKRQALITHTVTKGLNPDAPMKDSGIEWLGEVPAHWTTPKLKHVLAEPITDGPHETPIFLDEGIPFVSAEAVGGGFVDFCRIRGFISEEDHARFSKKYRPRAHDIFMVKSGATTGVTAIVDSDIEFNIWSPLAAMRCSEKVAPKFLLYFLRSIPFQDAIALSWSFGTQQNIGMGVLGNMSVVLPPPGEQLKILAFLAMQCGKTEHLLSKTGHSIALLQERRSALITAAVTGKIDLRDAA